MLASEQRRPTARLDPTRITSWLRDAVVWPARARLCDVRVNRLWAGRQGRITFELALVVARDGAEATYTLQGGTGVPDRPSRRRAHVKFASYGLSGLRLADRAGGLWCCTPDRDRKLPSIRNLLDPQCLGDVLATTQAGTVLPVGGTGVSDGLRVELVAYRATKRCVLRARMHAASEVRSVFLKVFRRPPHAGRIRLMRRLADRLAEDTAGRIRVPAILDFVPALRLLISAGAAEEARPLAATLEDTRLAARTLGRLHAMKPDDAGSVHTAADEVETVSRWLGALSSVSAADCVRFREVVRRLRGRCATLADSNGTLIHRDFYRTQLLRRDDTIWLTDLDTLTAGAAELDVSTYTAHVVLDELRSGASMEQARQHAQAFTDAYRACGGGLDPRRMGFYQSCALARLGALQLARGVEPQRRTSGGAPDATGLQLADRLWQLAAESMSDRHACGS